MALIADNDTLFETAAHVVDITSQSGVSDDFKAGFDKPDRLSSHPFRGPGLKRGPGLIADARDCLRVAIITEVHEPFQAVPAAEMAEILRLPAFVVRQTNQWRQ